MDRLTDGSTQGTLDRPTKPLIDSRVGNYKRSINEFERLYGSMMGGQWTDQQSLLQIRESARRQLRDEASIDVKDCMGA